MASAVLSAPGMTQPSETFASPPPHDPLRALWHRWFVEYNPLYLASSALVLGGLWLVAHEASASATLGAILGVGATAELYALALIAAAACLVRMGMRRPAAMLGLLAVIYQGDVMLRVEAAAFLPGIEGPILSLAWALFFTVKLVALAKALELRLSRSALLVPSLGAFTLAAMPHVLRALQPADRTAPVMVAVFALGALGLWTTREVRSAVGFDVRGVRSIRATWLVWSALALGHVLFWSSAFGVRVVALAPVALLLATRFVEHERSVWALVAFAMISAGVVAPPLFPLVAAMAAVVLVLRALRAPVIETPEPEARVASPYRDELPPLPAAVPVTRFAPADRDAVTRLLLGALTSTYLACWSSSASWPDHALALDGVFTLAALAFAWQRRSTLPALPLSLVHLHLARELGLFPGSTAGWGWISIALGFATLALAVFVSARGRSRLAPVSSREAPAPDEHARALG